MFQTKWEEFEREWRRLHHGSFTTFKHHVMFLGW